MAQSRIFCYTCTHMKKGHKLLVYTLLMLFFAQHAQAEPTLERDIEQRMYTKKLNPKNQSFCLKRSSGKTIYEHNQDQKIIPASVSKLYTFDFALAKLGTDFRYTTEVVYNHSTRSLYIEGGGDPHFVEGHLQDILRDITKKTGTPVASIYFSSTNFYYNWKYAPKVIATELQKTMKPFAHTLVTKKLNVQTYTTPYTGPGMRFTFSSSPLSVLLKQINNHSTNIATDVLFERLGGSSAFSAYMQDTYNVTTDTVYLTTGSGLRGNYTTCRLTLRVIDHLITQMDTMDLEPYAILTMPQVDPGVLKNRHIEQSYVQSIVAKSGYVNNNHALAGVIDTSKGYLYFGIFTYFDKEAYNISTKLFVDDVLTLFAKHHQKILASFAYTPSPAYLNKTLFTPR